MALWLRALVVLVEDQNLVPSSHNDWTTTVCDSFTGGFDWNLLWPIGTDESDPGPTLCCLSHLYCLRYHHQKREFHQLEQIEMLIRKPPPLKEGAVGDQPPSVNSPVWPKMQVNPARLSQASKKVANDLHWKSRTGREERDSWRRRDGNHPWPISCVQCLESRELQMLKKGGTHPQGFHASREVERSRFYSPSSQMYTQSTYCTATKVAFDI